MEIDNIRLIVIHSPLAEDKIEELQDIYKQVAAGAFRSAQHTGIIPGRTFTTKAYCDLDGRYFRMTLKFKAYPVSIILQDINEVTKDQYDCGIKEETRKHPDSSGWVDLNVK